MAYLEYFDPRLLALQQELLNHPELMERVARHPPRETEMRIAEIAAYCTILLDGYYIPEEINNLAALLTQKLYEKRTQIILQ